MIATVTMNTMIMMMENRLAQQQHQAYGLRGDGWSVGLATEGLCTRQLLFHHIHDNYHDPNCLDCGLEGTILRAAVPSVLTSWIFLCCT